MLQGEKTVELRRRQPRCKAGDWIAIYATRPNQVLVGVARVVEVKTATPRCLWQAVGAVAGISRADYESYFEGAKQAVGIVVEQPVEFVRHVPLTELRQAWPRFSPPQSFRYLSDEEAETVLSWAGLLPEPTTPARWPGTCSP